MIFKKEGLPEEGELVFCTVKRITPHAAFVSLDEYKDVEAMLHISEISSRWVKNIKDVIKEGEKIVCKVLSVSKEGHVDVSLKRVSSGERKRKLNDIKYQKKLEALISFVFGRAKKSAQKTIKEVFEYILENFGDFTTFYEVVKEEGSSIVDELPIPEKYVGKFKEKLEEQILSQRVKLNKYVNVSTYDGRGIDLIKEFFKVFADKLKKEGMDVQIKYISSPRYFIEITTKDYKTGEKAYAKVVSEMKDFAKKNNLIFSTENEQN